MVKLDRITTRGGDKGETSLGDGRRVRKSAPRIAAIGEVDEANAAIGLARAQLSDAIEAERLARVQNDLFDLGADLAVPVRARRRALRVGEAQVRRLEAEIDAVNARLAPLASFVLPGGSAAAAHLHLARTAVRRAERAVVALAARERVGAPVLAYLNRLSDLLFVLARAANDDGRADLVWEPGRWCRPAPAG
ncbi:MAG: cob(I)yrinic acid a,c-diamide adenosyltransferase [Proteobacteria bacterium]|nr:cob(I)yrinic acid a,c-diamide adenosyltransferase [Pseudomonadota bacterium]